jgi:hypothetical protein
MTLPKLISIYSASQEFERISKMSERNIILKCGCEVTPEGNYVLGRDCADWDCRECRIVQRLHPFGTARFADSKINLVG